jgi:protein-ribulosamine 3-kinase
MHLSSSLQTTIRQKLSAQTFSTNQLQFLPVSGGSINETYRINFGSKNYFCKINSATKFPQLFSSEKKSLALIAKQQIIQTPSVMDCFEKDDKQVLLLEWIPEGNRTDDFWKKFGEQLALLHNHSAPQFGLSEDNYMGSVPQSNRQHSVWTSFFAEERLIPMVDRCFQKSLLTKFHRQQFDQLYKKLPTFFEPEQPSLLHGDLWSGNFMCNEQNNPFLIDPAVYYGHRSVDLAMTTLFGGFHPLFYEAYHYHFPLPANYKEQWTVCNLYPLLIHLYLFGSGYRGQIEQTLTKFE